MAAHMASLQDQVNVLFDNLNNLRGNLGQPTPPIPQQIQPQQQQQPLPAPSQTTTPIDPSLQSHAFGLPRAPSNAPMSISPSQGKSRSFSQQQPQASYRGPTSNEFSFGVADNSLQTMGITDGSADANGEAVHELQQATASPGQLERSMQIIQDVHEEKDPIYTVSKAEALRLCRVYEDEMGLMYPVLDINTVMEYTERLYSFIDAARRNGLVQQGFPGPDAIDDENTIVLKMIIACASTMEGSGRSDLGRNIFQSPGVQEAISRAEKDYMITHKAPRLLVLAVCSVNLSLWKPCTNQQQALYEFHCDNEVASWRIVGLAARRCVELGLHRHETYEKITDPTERSRTVLLFWSVYILDRRFSFGTGMPFALQDTDVDPQVPKPEDRTSYISAMARFCEISSRVWRTVSKTPTAANDGSGTVNVAEMAYLDYQVIDWHRSIPPMLKFEHPSQPPQHNLPPSRGGHRLRVILYLRANQMRIHIYRPVLHSATSIMQNRQQAQTSVDVAKDTIRVLTHISQTSDIYHTQQALFNPFLTGALAVLFLAVAHTPAEFAESVREEFYMALELVRVLSKGSPISNRLWNTIRHLKRVGPKLGLAIAKDDEQSQSQSQSQEQRQPPPQQMPTPQSQPSQALPQSQASPQYQQPPPLKAESDPSRSAAVAMAGLAGVNVNETDLYNGQRGSWTEHSSSPEGMAHDLTSLFEAAGGLQAMGQGQQHQQQQVQQGLSQQQPVEGGAEAELAQGGLTGMLDDLF